MHRHYRAFLARRQRLLCRLNQWIGIHDERRTVRGSISRPVDTAKQIPGLVGPGITRFPATTDATRLVAELFRILTSSEPSGKWLSVVAICASNEKAHASADASEITVFIPIVSADLPEITSFYLRVKVMSRELPGGTDHRLPWSVMPQNHHGLRRKPGNRAEKAP